MDRDLLTLPFDQYGRYAIVRDALAAARPDLGARLRVLDVGGYFRTRRGVELLPAQHFLRDDDVTVLDLPACALPGYVQGDGRGLAFEGDAFDIVVSCDTLEHVPAADRPGFWAELLRVARYGVLLIAPFATEGVEQAERLVYDFIRAELGQDQPQLQEHRAFGLPDVARTAALLGELGLRHAMFPSGSVHAWVAMMLARHMRPYAYDDELIEGLDRYYSEHLRAYDRREPAYRRLVAVERRGAWLAAVRERLGAPGAPAPEPAWDTAITWLAQAAQQRQQAEQRQQAGAQAARIQALEQELLWTTAQLEAACAQASWLERQAHAAHDELERIKRGRALRLLRRLRP